MRCDLSTGLGVPELEEGEKAPKLAVVPFAPFETPPNACVEGDDVPFEEVPIGIEKRSGSEEGETPLNSPGVCKDSCCWPDGRPFA